MAKLRCNRLKIHSMEIFVDARDTGKNYLKHLGWEWGFVLEGKIFIFRPILDAFKSLASDSCADITADIEDLTLESCHLNKYRKFCSFENKCTRKCGANTNITLEISTNDGKVWLRPANLAELLKIFTTKTLKSEYMLIGGNTAHGKITRFLFFECAFQSTKK